MPTYVVKVTAKKVVSLEAHIEVEAPNKKQANAQVKVMLAGELADDEFIEVDEGHFAAMKVQERATQRLD